MIPIEPKPEPPDFAERVRRPGTTFLEKVPHPNTKQWENKEYWRKSLPDMRKLYNMICAYSSHWISLGGHSIDHFVPRASRPDLAYEWNNFRYVFSKFNARKGIQDILDPFQLEPDWFILDFDTFMVKPNPSLAPEQKAAVQHTIDTLKLSEDEDCIELRQDYVKWFRAGEITFALLERTAPFIAYELQRQGLV